MAIEPGRQFQYQIRYSPAGSSPTSGAWHQVTAHTPDGAQVGSLMWHKDSNELGSVRVAEEHQRRGVATAMWNRAIQANPKLTHSAERSHAGDQWAKSVGGELPDRIIR